MQDSRREYTNENNNAKQSGQDRPSQEVHTSLEPYKIDQQEGNMNHGTLGGNFGEDIATKHNESADNDQ